MDTVVADALVQLGRADPDRAEQARRAWHLLSGGVGPAAVTQWRVQQFCWTVLPHLGPGPAARRHGAAQALGDLLSGLGLPRYARIAAGATTARLIEAADRPGAGAGPSHQPVRVVRQQAMRRSGIEPPDTALLSWGAHLDTHERRARDAAAERLELAIAAGEIRIGARSWRQRQQETTVDVLCEARADLDGSTFYDRILDERLERWIRGPGSTARRGLLTPLAPALRRPVAPPADAGGLLRPLSWLLAQAEPGLALTGAGYLPPALVGRAQAELGWPSSASSASSASSGSSSRPREVSCYPVTVLKRAALRLGLLRRRGGILLRTPAGRAAAADPQVLFTEVAAALVGPAQSALADGWEVVLATLADGGAVCDADLRHLVRVVVLESGWQFRGRSQPHQADSDNLYYAVRSELVWLGLVEQSGPPADPRVRALPGAQVLFLATLRHRLVHRTVVRY